MGNKKWLGIFLIFIILAFLIVRLQYFGTSKEFVNYPLPLSEMHKVMDVGIVDANNDNLLDIYTSNHNFKQVLLIADEHGNYHDSLDDWGLNQSREFPGVELSYVAPELDKAGLYIYWLGSGGNDEQGHNVIIRTHKTGETGNWNGTLQINAPVEIDINDGFTIESQPQSSPRAKTTINFSATGDALLSLKLTTWGLPITFEIKGDLQPSQIYVGNKKITPQSTSFTMALQDRHGLAWADYNNDGKMDVFTSRGALGGGLSQYPESVQNTIKDAFFVSEANEPYKDAGSEHGFVKNGCSGRHTKWIDFNQDGLLDLYINCQDRGRMKRDFPKQLYQQDKQGRFTDVATEVGLGIPDHQLIDFAWLDADNDGDADLLTTEDKGFFLYRNQAGRFSRESIGRGKFARDDRPGLKHVTLDYWNFDGKLTIADYDADGDLDAFSTSKEGNTLLVNNTGKYSPVDPVTIGLPSKSVGGNWVDYDNDGLPDFHAVPEGLFKQHTGNFFEVTNLLVLPSHKYQAAISNWADLDNDGRRDVVIALNENSSLWRWWERPFKSPQDVFKWKFLSYRNIGTDNHWLEIRLDGTPGNLQAIGASVTVVTTDGQQTMEVGNNEGAFFSQGHYRLYFGLGQHDKAKAVNIRWPDGSMQELNNVPADALLVVKQQAPAEGAN